MEKFELFNIATGKIIDVVTVENSLAVKHESYLMHTPSICPRELKIFLKNLNVHQLMN